MISKKECYKKLEFYTREITNKRPHFDTVFRTYYDSLVSVSKILHSISENPWHPDNWHADEIFEDIEEQFEELEKLRIKSQ